MRSQIFKVQKQTAELPVTPPILRHVITDGWGEGVCTVCCVCKEEGGDKSRGETDEWQCERKMLMKTQSMSKGKLEEEEGDGGVGRGDVRAAGAADRKMTAGR